MIEHGFDILNAGASILDVAQVANVAAEEETPAWLGGVLGFVVVMAALILIWVACSLVGTYFAKADSAAKRKPAPGKSEAAPKAAATAAPAAAAEEIPLIAIIAAAAHVMQAPIRNIVVRAPGLESVTWSSQGREAIYTSHAPKLPSSVRPIGTVKK